MLSFKSISGTAFLPHNFFSIAKKKAPLPIDQQISEIRQQIASTQHRFHALATICEGGSDISKGVLSSLKNWNLLTDDILSLCTAPTSSLRKTLMLDAPKNFKKFNKLSIQFTQLINCYQTSYSIDRIKHRISALPEGHTLDLHKELSTLSEQATQNQKKTQTKFIREVVTEIFNNYAPNPVSLLTGLSSKISDKLCKFTVLVHKQWNTHQETNQHGNNLQTFLAVLETLPRDKSCSAVQRLSTLLEAKARQERFVNRLKKFEDVADAIWIIARVLLLFPSFMPLFVSRCLGIGTDNILFKGSGVFSIIMADSLRKWITPDGLFVLSIHGVAMRYLRPHEYSWQGMKYKLSLQGYLIGKKICVVRALANYSWGAIQFLTVRILYRRYDEDTSHIHSFTVGLTLSCASIDQRIALLQSKIQHLQLLDLQPNLQKETDLVAEISRELEKQSISSFSKEIQQLMSPFLEKVKEEPKKAKATSTSTSTSKTVKPPLYLPDQKILSEKIRQLLLADEKAFEKYIGSVVKTKTKSDLLS